MSSTKVVKHIERLTPDQEARLQEWRDKWIAIGLSTEPADFERFERAARACYRFAGLEQPRVVIHVSSPLALAIAAPTASYLLAIGRAVGRAVDEAIGGAMDEAVGRAVRSAVDGAVGRAVDEAIGGAIDEAVGRAVRSAVDGAVGRAVDEAIGGAMDEAVGRAVRSAVDGAVGRAIDEAIGGAMDEAVDGTIDGAVRRTIGRAWGRYIGGQFWAGGWWWTGSPASASYFRQVCGLRLAGDLDERALAYAETVQSVCWWWPHREFVMVSDRPREIRRDERGRLHNPSGMAISWRDGWGIYAWHGIHVPERVIRCDYTAQEALAEPNVEIRRCMIERMGTDAFVKALKPKVVNRDQHTHHVPVVEAVPGVNEDGQAITTYAQTGVSEVLEHRELLKIALPKDDPDRHMLAVHVTCPSKGSEYYLRVPPTTKTCQEAVAWTFGETAERWNPEFES